MTDLSAAKLERRALMREQVRTILRDNAAVPCDDRHLNNGLPCEYCIAIAVVDLVDTFTDQALLAE